MDFRWKNRGGNLPNVQPNFVDPQNTQATAANPQAPFQPGGPSQSPQDFLTGVTNQADRTAKLAKLGELKEKLVAIDAEIAKVKASPMSRETETAVAAKLAEIGDTSAYQAILARQQNQAAQQKSNASAIDNMLFEADKISWGLSSKSDEERAVAKQTIKAHLEQAKRVAEQTRTPLPPKYRELEQKLADSDEASENYASARKRANELWLLARNKKLEKADIKEMEDYIAANPNSDISGQYRQLIDQYQGKTREAKASASKRKADALDLYYSLNGLDPEAAAKRIANLTPRERKLLEDFYPEMLK